MNTNQAFKPRKKLEKPPVPKIRRGQNVRRASDDKISSPVGTCHGTVTAEIRGGTLETHTITLFAGYTSEVTVFHPNQKVPPLSTKPLVKCGTVTDEHSSNWHHIRQEVSTRFRKFRDRANGGD